MNNLLIQSMSLIAFQLPELLASVLAVLLFWFSTPAAPGRPLARAGSAVMLGACLIRAVLAVVQAWILQPDANRGTTDIATLLGMLSAVSMLVNIVAVVGLVLLILGARKAMLQAAGR